MTPIYQLTKSYVYWRLAPLNLVPLVNKDGVFSYLFDRLSFLNNQKTLSNPTQICDHLSQKSWRSTYSYVLKMDY